jgi:hypothetical protein
MPRAKTVAIQSGAGRLTGVLQSTLEFSGFVDPQSVFFDSKGDPLHPLCREIQVMQTASAIVEL